MKIAIGADHAGFEFKEELKSFLIEEGYEVSDFGAYELNENDGFPDFAIPVSRAVSERKYERGVLVCGSGIGVSIAANKVRGVRAVNCVNEDFAKLSRLHNDTNVLSLGADYVTVEEAKEILITWLTTEFEGGRHQERLDLVADIENENMR